MRVQGWDPVLYVVDRDGGGGQQSHCACGYAFLKCAAGYAPLPIFPLSPTDKQIICLQAIHYLALSLVVPPLLTGFAKPALLEYSGGSQTVAHIMDWREMAARPAVNNGEGAWKKLRGAWAGGKKVSSGDTKEDAKEKANEGENSNKKEKEKAWDYGVDDRRGWIIGFSWLVASVADIVPLYYLVRRPTYILDFSLTLTFVHLIFTTYIAKSFPTSLFFWIVQALGAVTMVSIAEQLCVQREMKSDLELWQPDEAIELLSRDDDDDRR